MTSRIKLLAETVALLAMFSIFYALLFIAPELDAALNAAMGRT
tara:strand:+ start:102 stop:230 length:129 start_codon:yes stop_codon:yes gene_type:complete